MEYMRCLNCNSDIPHDSAFCPFCGSNISELKEKFEKERAEREQRSYNGELIRTYNQDAILKRAFLFLEDGEFDRADTYLENVLDNDPENAWAYVGKLMIDLKVKIYSDLKNAQELFENNGNYIKALRFGDEKLKIELKKQSDECIENVKIKKEQQALDNLYQKAYEDMTIASTEYTYIRAAEKFEAIKEYKDSEILAKKCREQAEIEKKEREEADRDGIIAAFVVLGLFLAIIAVLAIICS